MTGFKSLFGGALLLGLLLALSGPARADVYTLSDHNSTLSIDLTPSTYTVPEVVPHGQFSWTVGNKSHMARQWYFVQINDGPLVGFHQLLMDTPRLADTNSGGWGLGDPRPDSMTLFFADSLDQAANVPNHFYATVNYTLRGGMSGNLVSDFAQIITLSNRSTTGMQVKFYQFMDLDVSEYADDDGVYVANANAIVQGDADRQITTVLTGNFDYELGFADDLLARLTAGDSDVELANNRRFAVGDVAWAAMWEVHLGAIGSNQDTYIISEDTNIAHAPEPTTMFALGMACLGLARYSRRRRLV